MRESKQINKENVKNKIKRKIYMGLGIITTAMLITSIAVQAIPIKKINNIEPEKKAETEYGYDKPYMPIGFKYVEGNWDTGYVIEDEKNNNQFVWVPVDGTNIKLDRKDFSVTQISSKNCYEEIDPTYALSVNQYGGFYIARYEAGLPDGLGEEENKESRNVSGMPVSKKNNRVWNYIDYETAKNNANEMYASSVELTSSLMNSYAYDTTLTWLERSGYNVDTNSGTWGNYTNHAGTNNTVENAGSSEDFKANNIYDLAGNIEEWTTERNNNNQITRGGNYTNSGNVAPAGDRTSTTKSRTANLIGYRPILYKTGPGIVQGYDTPYLPVGFKYVEGTWENGYVIEDELNGNQYVWIPVSGKESAILQRKDFANTFISKDKTTDELDLEFKISVYRNGGFYVSRYEAGTPDGVTLQNTRVARNINGVPVSKKNVDVWTNITYENASINAKKMYQNNQEVKSSLINSYAYDVMATWLEQNGYNLNDSSSWGNYTNNSNNNQNLKTGSNEAFKSNNIYDLAGNAWEMTTETYGAKDIIVRGGDYLSTGDSTSAGTRESSGKSEAFSYTGFRTILYKSVSDSSEEGTRNGSNIPQVTNGMIPVKWNGTEWISTTIDDKSWYNYEKQQWANVMLADGSMMVWIPRYAYRITSNYHTDSATGGDIEIKFLKGQTNNPIDGTRTIIDEGAGENNWRVPEAFTYGNKQLEGLWIGKYRTSKQDATGSSAGTSNKIQIKAGVTVSSETLNNAFTIAQSMNEDGNVFGLPTDDNTVDPHLMKNTEFGALAYLTQSSYGRNGTSVAYNSTSISGNIGVNSTTTGNETGVYDISNNGNLVAAYLDNGTGTLSTYASNLLESEEKYKDKYITGTTDTQELNYEANKNRTDAMYETSSNYTGNTSTWYKGYSNYSTGNNSLISRGYGKQYSFDNYGTSVAFFYYTTIAVITPVDTMDESQLREIQLNVNSTDPRNTQLEGTLNGIQSGVIKLKINYENFETENTKKYQYRVGGESSKWVMADKIQELEIKENTTIDVRYFDGQKSYGEKTINITNIDNIKPDNFELFATNTQDSLTIEGTTIDRASDGAAESVAGILRYEYKIDNGQWQSENTFYNLSPNSIHTVYMRAIDKAGNETMAYNSGIKVKTGYGILEYDNISNIPITTKGMTPVKWNGTQWVDTTLDDKEWYDYSNQKWANVRLEDGSMFVWIPRYAYNIDANWGTNNVSDIKIKFLRGKTNITIQDSETIFNREPGENKWLVHPAFEYGDTQLEGIWIGKYYASRTDATELSIGNSENIQIKSGVYPENENIGDAYNNCIKMNDEQNIYGLDTDDNKVDPHLLKNTEWASMMYLAQSMYGTNKYITGSSSKYVTGITQTTTGNETGIYDFELSFRLASNFTHYAYEFTAAYLDNNSSSLNQFAQSLLQAPEKHKNVYEKGDIDTVVDNYNKNKNKYGDAIVETTEGNTYMYSTYPFIHRFTGKFNMNVDSGGSMSGGGMFGNRSHYRPSIAVIRQDHPIDEKDLGEIDITADITTPRNTQTIGEQNGITTGPITITIEYNNTEYNNPNKYQFKIGENGIWQNSEKTQIFEITENTTIYTRYFDGINEYKSKSYIVNNVDNNKPEQFKLKPIIEDNKIIIQGETTDTASEGARDDVASVRYKYKLDDGDWQNDAEFTGLTKGTTHAVSMKAIDNAGNETIAYNSGLQIIVGEGIKEYDNTSNIPKLSTGMTPIKWDGAKWIDTTVTDKQWYDYSNKNWANVRLEDGSMLVWIPRYAYSIQTNYHTTSATGGEIQVKFLKGKTNDPIDGTQTILNTETGEGNWLVHPAFEYGDKQLEGIWIGKFEASMSDATAESYNTKNENNYYGGTVEQIKIIPGVASWRNIKIGDAYDKAVNMNNQNNPYGLQTDDTKVDPHLVKATEWGAVAYLTQSTFGKNSEVYINNNYYYLTGNSGGSTNIGSSSSTYSYETIQGQGASTTGNITGIYDMNGGSTEYVAAYINNNNTYLTTNGEALLNAPKEHKNIYEIGTTDTYVNNYEKAKIKYGDVLYETSSNTGVVGWYGDYVQMLYSSNAFMTKGMQNNNGTQAGVFTSSSYHGAEVTSYGFRIALAITEIDETDSSKLQEIEITPDITTPRNTQTVGILNGVETGPITLTVNYNNTDINNQIQYQYQIGSTNGKWINATKTQQIPIYDNTTVYVRYFDGTTEYQAKSITITNVDNEIPQITSMGLDKQGNTITVTGVSSDELSQIQKTLYKLENGDWQESNKFNNVTQTTYKIYMKSIDIAGNETIAITTVENGKIISKSLDNTRYGVNMPELTNGMTPIKWDGTQWVDTTVNDKEWFNYKEQNWANIRLEDGSMFVWIPRYAYNITKNYHTNAGSSATGDIEIKFLKGNGNIPVDGSDIEIKNVSGQGNWNIHPSFIYDGRQLNGIWVAKYQASHSDATSGSIGIDTTIGFKEGVRSYRVNINDAYSLATLMNTEGNIYGLPTDTNIVDSHLMKNTEWGSVSYLTNSVYGQNKRIVVGNTTTTAYGGVTGSTTGNETGIYDMSASQEYVAAYVDNNNASLTNYAQNLLNAPAKHKNTYIIGISDNSTNNNNANADKYGDAIYETSTTSSTLYGGTAGFPNTTAPIFVRSYSDTLSYYMANGNTAYGFRAAIIVGKKEIEIIPNVTTPRNTTKVGQQNGIEMGPIKVAINYNSQDLDFIKQYKIGDGTWTNAKSVQELEITENTTIYARYFNGTTSYGEIAYNILNVDNTQPIISDIKLQLTNENSIKVIVTAEDSSGILKQEYKLGDGQWQESNIFFEKGIYDLAVKVIDEAGNETIKNITYNSDEAKTEVKVGDFINYTAGIWTQEEIDELTSKNLYTGGSLPSSSTPFKFGAFKVGDSKDNSYSKFYSNGWRVLSTKEDGTINIIHAGIPELYFNPRGDNTAYQSEYILSNGERQTSYNTYQARNWNMYINSRYAISAHCMTKDEALDTTSDFRTITTDYWVASANTSNYLSMVMADGIITSLSNKSCGVRPVVTLKPNVEIVGGTGSSESPYEIGLSGE